MATIGYAGTPTFNIPANRMRYILVSPGNNTLINLPPLLIQSDPITIINFGTISTVMQDTSLTPSFVQTIQPQTSITVIPSALVGTWQNSSVASTENISFSAPLIPLMITGNPGGSSSGWVPSASTSGTGSGPEQAWLGLEANTWYPTVVGGYNQISHANISILPLKIGISTPVGTPIITNLVVTGSTDRGATFTTLLTYTTGINPNTNYLLPVLSTNTYFNTIRFTVVFATLPVVGQGINFLQIYGSY